jgi:hypothetical protein
MTAIDSEKTTMKKKMRMIALITVATLGFAGNTESLSAQGRNDIIVQSGQTIPGGNGTFSTFQTALLNDSGQVAFFSNLFGTPGGTLDNQGVYLGTGGTATQIARTGQIAPGGNGTLSGFTTSFGTRFSLNNAGQVAILAGISGTSGGNADNLGYYRGTGGSLTQMARLGQPAPGGNGTLSGFDDLSAPLLNDSGAIAYRVNLSGTSGGSADNTGIYLSSGTSQVQIAREAQSAPDGNGTFSQLDGYVLNNAGSVLFRGNLTGTSGGSSDNSGLFRGNGGGLTQIARRGQVIPGGSGTLGILQSFQMNDLGTVAFRSDLNGTSGADNQGVYRGNGGSLTQIVRKGQLAPDGNGTLDNFISVEINNAGTVGFYATLAGTAQDSGIFRGTGGSLTQIAREGQLAPGGNGMLGLVHFAYSMNETGTVAFTSPLTGTSGGSTDDRGIFASDGIEMVQVVRKGDAISGSTVTAISDTSRPSMNNAGQVTYVATLANGNQVVRRWTPELRWRQASSSAWDTAGRWTLSLNPGAVHDVFIDPAASVTVTGPTANTTVRSLQIGGGTGLATLDLRNGAILTSTNGVAIASTGTLTGDGSIAGIVTNNGNVRADNLTINGTLTNNNVISGNGRIHGSVVNNSGARVRVLGGNNLWLSGPSFTNAGLVEVHGGSELQVDATLNNLASSGLISVRDSSLVGRGGINNAGSMAMTLGNATIHGDVNNTGIIQVSGGAHATFFDDLTQNGAMQVSRVGNTNSVAVLLGAFSGNGGFTGGGDVFALGDLRPGNSPASVLYDGNLFMGNSTNTRIELGGTGIGRFDQIIVSGDFNISGNLWIDLIALAGQNATYVPQVGDAFQIFAVGGAMTGQFQQLFLPSLYTGLLWNTSQLYSDGILRVQGLVNAGESSFVLLNKMGRDTKNQTAPGHTSGSGSVSHVPEPSSATLMFAALLCYFFRRR